MIHGPVGQGDAVLGAGLGEDVADMVVDGALADRQFNSDLLIGQAARHQRDDLDFPFGEISPGFVAGAGMVHGCSTRLMPVTVGREPRLQQRCGP